MDAQVGLKSPILLVFPSKKLSSRIVACFFEKIKFWVLGVDLNLYCYLRWSFYLQKMLNESQR